jgi:Na+/H+-dicarboxylate symporter
MLSRLSLPVQLCIIILATLLLGSYIPEIAIRFFYTVSLCFKEILGFLLPLIIFSFVFMGLISLKRNAPFILAILIGSIFISNGCVALLTYAISCLVLPSIVGTVCIEGLSCGRTLEPLLTFTLPKFFRADYALFAAIILGLLFAFIPMGHVERGIARLKEKLEHFFTYIFIPILPIYVFGFLLEIHYKGVLLNLIKNYGGAFFLIVLLQWALLFGMYWLAMQFDYAKTKQAIRNALGSYLTAFSTMSSTATVPVAIKAAEINTGNSALANVAMPIMANVHLLGDAISTPILAMVTMLLFFGKMPTLALYIYFAWKFCLSMFAVAGVPAGGILVMIPVLQMYLGFTDEMIGIMMTLYILLDSFGTAANVMGDGALVIMVDKVIKRLKLV